MTEDEKLDESFQDITEGLIPKSRIGYNKISIDACSFHIELISPFENMDNLQGRMAHLLLLCFDEDFRNKWKEQSKRDIKKLSKKKV